MVPSREPRIALIGHGAIGSAIADCLGAAGGAPCAVLVRPGRRAPAAVNDLAGLLAASPSCVLECAGHAAVVEYGEGVLAAGVDLVVSSVGALADAAVAERLLAAERDGARLLFPAGAVAGLDGLVAARTAGLSRVRYTSFKPPRAWRGTAAEDVLDLDHAEAERGFFAGSAREAALAYPKNANVAVAIALAGLGMDRTEVRLVSSREVADPLGLIEAEGAFGRFRFEILAHAAATNPRTSALTAYSLLESARMGIALPVRALLSRPG